MIAPVRKTSGSQDEQAQLLARARRAIARGLISRAAPPSVGSAIAPWAAWLLVGWITLVAATTWLAADFWRFSPY